MNIFSSGRGQHGHVLWESTRTVFRVYITSVKTLSTACTRFDIEGQRYNKYYFSLVLAFMYFVEFESKLKKWPSDNISKEFHFYSCLTTTFNAILLPVEQSDKLCLDTMCFWIQSGLQKTHSTCISTVRMVSMIDDALSTISKVSRQAWSMVLSLQDVLALSPVD